jgi:hypothetical protein
VVTAGDIDGDGDLDLFVGARSIPWRYGIDPSSQLLLNDGRGHFTDIVANAPGLKAIGMVTDALWHDIDGDRKLDLIVVGEWMPVVVYRNRGAGKFERLMAKGLEKSDGWWTRIIAADLDGDGRSEFVLGNFGRNIRLHASANEPLTMIVKDFDKNDFVEQVIGMYNGGKQYPLVLRDDLIKAVPPWKARFLNFKDYALKTLDDVVPAAERSDAIVKQVYRFESAVLRRSADGAFAFEPLPLEAQMAPVFGLAARDVNGDGRQDVLLAGNFDGVKPEFGRMAASDGLVLLGGENGTFTTLRPAESGFRVPGQARGIATCRTKRGMQVIVARNNAAPLVFSLGRP